MSNKKQSSIEQVFSHIKASRNDIQYWNDSMLVDWLLEQEDRLKAMHKEEMRDLYLNHVTKAERLRKIFEKQFEELYNERFGGEK